MAEHGEQFEKQAGSLIDLHLGQLPTDEAAVLARMIETSPPLQHQSERCGRLLQELDAYEIPVPSGDLAERILDRIAKSETLIPFPPADSKPVLTGVEHGNYVSTALFSLRELIVIAACIALFVGIFIPGYYKAQAISRRNLCRHNMQQMYTGLSEYATANAGFLPYAGSVNGGSWLRARTPGVLRASNTRHMYLTVKEGYLPDTRIFICPGQEHGVAMVMDNYRKVDDFAEPANVSYSFQNNNTDEQSPMERVAKRLVYIADANPYFSGRMAHVIDPMASINSYAHEANAGQNVLTLDGRVGWVSRPTVGVDNDNIYQAGVRRHYVGTELPQSSTDSFLVP